MEFFRSQLTMMGYCSISENNKTWQRDTHKVIVCLADDIATCRTGDYFNITDLFDRNTTVITDNRVNCPTVYTVCQLPISWFGIYCYRPQDQQWRPSRRFTFSVNRLDSLRLRLILELTKRSMHLSQAPIVDHVNFNCWSWNGDNTSAEGKQSNFMREFDSMPDALRENYEEAKNILVPQMPLLNHDLEIEQSHVSSWLNIVVETYSGETTVAISEKLFRALVTPVPWVVYAGKHTVAYLRSMGFDVLTDIVDHGYDNAVEKNTGEPGDKMVDFFWAARQIVQELKARNFNDLSLRCQQAATHNQKLLHSMSQKWPKDFAAWLPGILDRVS